MDSPPAKRASSPNLGSFLLVIALMLMPVTFEIAANTPMPRAFYLGYTAFGGMLLWLGDGLRWTRRTTASVLVFVGALACVHLVPWSPRKVFLVKFERVEPGMTVEGVDALLEHYIHRDNRSSHNDLERSYWHDPTGRYDADVGTVRFRDERVVETRLLWD